jgi:hypothetical protein
MAALSEPSPLSRVLVTSVWAHAVLAKSSIKRNIAVNDAKKGTVLLTTHHLSLVGRRKKGV